MNGISNIKKYQIKKKEAKQEAIEGWLKVKESSKMTLKEYCCQNEFNYFSMLRWNFQESNIYLFLDSWK